MTQYKKKIGAWGEQVAADWLAARRGYKICARNVRTPYGEIDVIAELGDVTIFVEVKTLTNSKTLLPEDNVTPRKMQHMLAAAQFYADERGIDHWQIDVVSVEGSPQKNSAPVVTHFENAV